MLTPMLTTAPIERVRAILLAPRQTLLMIKRVKLHNALPYWVAPGGGMESHDRTLRAALVRELDEELGARTEILRHAFTLRHTKGGKDLQEYFYLCRLLSFDLKRRNGPEFEDPARGAYLPDFVKLHAPTLRGLNIKTPELTDWLVAHLPQLKAM